MFEDDFDIEVLSDINKSGAKQQNSSSEQNESTKANIQELVDKVRNSKEFDDKFEAIQQIYLAVIPTLTDDLLAKTPNVARSMVASRLINTIKSLQSAQIAKQQLELSSEINIRNPKFGLIMGWFIEAIDKAARMSGFEQIQINQLFDNLAYLLVGWEDKIERKIKGTSGRAALAVENPLLEDFKDRLAEIPAKSMEGEINDTRESSPTTD